jgi:hypothetical protein
MNDIRPQRQWERDFNSLSPAEQLDQAALCLVALGLILAEVAQQQTTIDLKPNVRRIEAK